MGWRLYRVWSTEWFHNREHSIESLLAAVGRAVAGHAPPAKPPPIPPPPTKLQEPSGAAQTRYASAFYQVCPPIPLSREALLLPGGQAELVAAIEQITSVEGPIHEELLLKRLKAFSDVRRASPQVENNFKDALATAVTRGRVVDLVARFYGDSNKPLEAFRARTDETRLPLEWVCTREIELAILHIVEAALSIQREAIPAVVAKQFGVARLSADQAERIRLAVDHLIDGAQLEVQGPNVVLA
jgi:hypothetical protein